MDQSVAALVPLLSGYFGWNLARTKCLAGLIIALIKVRAINFMQLATALPDGVLKDSKYQRIQLQRVGAAGRSPLLKMAVSPCTAGSSGSISASLETALLSFRDLTSAPSIAV